jgi:hypothetical protein
MHLAFHEPGINQAPDKWPLQLQWSHHWNHFLTPAFPAVSFIYLDNLSSQVNEFEASAVASLVWLLRHYSYSRLLGERKQDGDAQPTTEDRYDTRGFWGRAVGIVTPHRAQMARVVQRLRDVFPEDSADAIYGAVDTVERYQGQQRDVILASFGIGDPDIIQAEDEFLYSLNRFNVLASRARAKVIVFATQSLLHHLSNDTRVLQESRLLKRFTESFCDEPMSVEVGYRRDGEYQARTGVLRRRRLLLQ